MLTANDKHTWEVPDGPHLAEELPAGSAGRH